MSSRLFSFVGGVNGTWHVVSISGVAGEPLPHVRRLDIVAGALPERPNGAEWVLRGLTSNDRYVTRSVKDQLVARQPALGRREATCTALIPIRKTASWSALRKMNAE